MSGRQTHNIVYRIALFFPFVAHGILRVISLSLIAFYKAVEKADLYSIL